MVFRAVEKDQLPMYRTPWVPRKGELLNFPAMYRRLVGRLIYFTITRPDLAYAVGVFSQFMHSPRIPHLEAEKRILRYLNLKLSPRKGI